MSGIGWLIVVGVGLLVVSAVWYFLARKFATGTTQTTGDMIAAFIDEAAMLTALTPAWLLAKKRGDAKILELLSAVRKQSATWDDAPAVLTIVPDDVGTAALLARIAALEAKGTTSTVPPASAGV